MKERRYLPSLSVKGCFLAMNIQNQEAMVRSKAAVVAMPICTPLMVMRMMVEWVGSVTSIPQI